MTNVLEISAPLKRHIKKGAQYAGLLPRVSCEATNLGDGSNNTIEGVDFMTQWIKKYSWQTEKLTAALLREGKVSKTDLAKTANGIYNFLYNHIQYTADGALQQLRSPACAWQQRYQGVDCKSYTIFTMCILHNLGLSAYIRQIKQPGFYPEQFTHVYVVVPINQKNNSLKKGYCVIDATKHTNTEGDFLVKKDRLMSGLKYQGLNAPVGLAKSKIDFGNIMDKLGDIIGGDIFSTPIDCWGGSAYDADTAKKDREIMINIFTNLLNQFKRDLNSKNYSKIGEDYARLEATEAIWWKVYDKIARYAMDHRNKCTRKNLHNTVQFIIYQIGDKRRKINSEILEPYFTRKKAGKLTVSFGKISKELYPIDEDPMTHTAPVWQFTPKPGMIDQLGDYNTPSIGNENNNSSGSNTGGFNTGGSNTGGSNTGHPIYDIDDIRPGVLVPPNNNNGTVQGNNNGKKEAGMGWLLPLGIIGGLVYMNYQKKSIKKIKK